MLACPVQFNTIARGVAQHCFGPQVALFSRQLLKLNSPGDELVDPALKLFVFEIHNRAVAIAFLIEAQGKCCITVRTLKSRVMRRVYNLRESQRPIKGAGTRHVCNWQAYLI